MNPDNNSYVNIIDFSPRNTFQMNAVLSDVYTWYIISQDKQFVHDIVLFDPCFWIDLHCVIIVLLSQISLTTRKR